MLTRPNSFEPSFATLIAFIFLASLFAPASAQLTGRNDLTGSHTPSSPPAKTELLEFTANWCGYCRQLEPTLKRLQRDGFAVRQIDFDRQPQLATKYRVHRLPTLLLVQNGQVLKRHEGLLGYDQLRSWFERNVASAPRHSAQLATEEPMTPVRVAPTGPTLANSNRQFDRSPRPSPTGTQPPAGTQRALPQAELARWLHDVTVRIRVEDDRSISFATGTIIEDRGGEALVVTCGHAFRGLSPNATVTVERFIPGQASPRQSPGKVVQFDSEKRDIGFVSFRPQSSPKVARLAGSTPTKGARVYSMGCNHGANPTLQSTYLKHINRYIGPQNLEIHGHPVQGRSGGGLFNQSGELVGLCNAADKEDNEGIYAGLESIQHQLRTIGRERLLTPTLPARTQLTSHHGNPTTDNRHSSMPHPQLNPQVNAANPAIRPPHSQRNPLIPRATNTPNGFPAGSRVEIICIVRDEQGRETKRVLFVPRASQQLVAAIQRESKQSELQRPESGQGSQTQLADRNELLLRAQSPR